ncbi:Maf-like protein [sediment metagenome]|uniref:Maf-like protein n=1 Tax=sediment metagenome TaxID=749907 RepID=D9PK74_9ZZZZ
MRIVICGSMKLANKMKEAKAVLEKAGHDVVLPPDTDASVANPNLNEEIEYCIRTDVIRNHFRLIADADAVLTLNYERKGIPGYIGSNTLMDMAIAHYLKKRVFLLYPVPDTDCAVEVKIMQPVILDGDISRVPFARSKVILASKSPRRMQLLEQLGVDFEVVESRVDESQVKESDPRELVRKLAMLKAEAVAKKVGKGHVIVAGDSVTHFNGVILGKPEGETEEKAKERARKMLRDFSGKKHDVYSGLCVLDTSTGKALTDFTKTTVRFRDLSERDIEACLNEKRVLGGAGAYVPETWPRCFEGIEGSHTNVLGTPTEKLIPMLRQSGVDV